MFELLNMMNNYDTRKVDNTVINEATIDTCLVTDSAKPFETGISHPDYNNGNWVIVELYDTKELAQFGHNKWVKLFSKKILPKSLSDVNECEFEYVARAMGTTLHKTYEKKTNTINTKTKTKSKKTIKKVKGAKANSNG